MSWAPGLATGERPSVAKQKRLELLTLLAQILPGGLARPHQIADRLMHRVRNPDPLELSCPQEPSQTGGVASVRLDVLARTFGDQRGRHNLTGMAERNKLAVEPIAGRAGFVAEVQPRILACELADEPLDGSRGCLDLTAYRTSPPRPLSAIATACLAFAASTPT